jgi:beta-lactamase class A
VTAVVAAVAAGALFGPARCDGQFCVQPLDGPGEVASGPDTPVVAGSVIKIPVALEAETQFAAGRLDPTRQVTLRASHRTPGPAGFSLFSDDVTVSLRDLVTAMLTISDNAATDMLLEQVGLDAVNERCAGLGLAGTVLASGLRTLVDSIGAAAGCGDWAGLTLWNSQPHSPEEEAEASRRVRESAALDAARTNRTTPRDMARLLRLIWADAAGPPAACARIRQTMAQQLTRHRLASGFRPPARVAAKSGGLIGVIRNEIGVITTGSGRRYAAAVFTQAHPGANDATVNAVIGSAAAMAVAALEPGGQQ